MAITNTLTQHPSGAVRANPVHYPVTFQFARSANATAYAAQDALGNGDGSSMEFTKAVRTKGGTARLKKVTVLMRGSITPADLKMTISSAAPISEAADNASYTVSDGDFPAIQAYLLLPSAGALSGNAIVSWNTSLEQETILQAAADSRSLFVTVSLGGSLTPVSSGLVTVILELAQD
jgi:hypothetical protein